MIDIISLSINIVYDQKEVIISKAVTVTTNTRVG